MTKKKSILDIEDFGRVSAEDEATNLQNYFVKTPVFNDLRAGKRQVVVGRKGSGKTALYLAIRDKASEVHHFAIPLEFKKYPWALQAAYSTQSGDAYIRFLESWRFLIFIELFKMILFAPNRATRFVEPDQKEALGAVETFIKKNWGTLSFSFKEMFPGGGLSLESLTLKPAVGTHGVTGSIGEVAVKRGKAGNYGDSLTRLNEWLWNCLIAIAPAAPPIFVLFDDLDQGFDPLSKDYMDRVTGLLLAVRLLTRDFADAKMSFKLIAFLRTDIFDRLHFGDKNKLISNNLVRLEWNKEMT